MVVVEVQTENSVAVLYHVSDKLGIVSSARTGVGAQVEEDDFFQTLLQPLPCRLEVFVDDPKDVVGSHPGMPAGRSYVDQLRANGQLQLSARDRWRSLHVIQFLSATLLHGYARVTILLRRCQPPLRRQAGGLANADATTTSACRSQSAESLRLSC